MQNAETFVGCCRFFMDFQLFFTDFQLEIQIWSVPYTLDCGCKMFLIHWCGPNVIRFLILTDSYVVQCGHIYLQLSFAFNFNSFLSAPGALQYSEGIKQRSQSTNFPLLRWISVANCRKSTALPLQPCSAWRRTIIKVPSHRCQRTKRKGTGKESHLFSTQTYIKWPMNLNNRILNSRLAPSCWGNQQKNRNISWNHLGKRNVRVHELQETPWLFDFHQSFYFPIYIYIFFLIIMN